MMKPIHTPDHKLYEQCYLNQARQKGGRLPAFHGTCFQRGYWLGSIFIGLFRCATPHLKQGAKKLCKKALQTSLNVAQDVLGEEHLKTATTKHVKQALGLPSQNSPQEQSGGGRKTIKRKAQPSTTFSSASAKKQQTTRNKTLETTASRNI